MDTATMIMIFAPIALIQLALQVFCLVDLVRRDKTAVLGGNKWIWVAVIIFGSLIGSIIYLVFARTEGSQANYE